MKSPAGPEDWRKSRARLLRRAEVMTIGWPEVIGRWPAVEGGGGLGTDRDVDVRMTRFGLIRWAGGRRAGDVPGAGLLRKAAVKVGAGGGTRPFRSKIAEGSLLILWENPAQSTSLGIIEFQTIGVCFGVRRLGISGGSVEIKAQLRKTQFSAKKFEESRPSGKSKGEPSDRAHYLVGNGRRHG